MATRNEEKLKIYNKKYADRRCNCESQHISVGDKVLVKQRRKNKLTLRYWIEPCEVINVTGTEVTIKTSKGTCLCRNKSYFKPVPDYYDGMEESDDDSDDKGHNEEEETVVEEEDINRTVPNERDVSLTNK